MAQGFRLADLYRAPELNPISRKARAIPVLNPVNMYGRVFFFSWFSFMVAFWAWYAFPPLLTVTIKADLNLTAAQVANSNIVSLCATLLVRVVAGPLCDLFGPRKVFGGLLLLGAVPTGLAPLIRNATGLYLVRFFMGILGGSFVPCQVWTTAFFDKNVVGSANALTGGWGNAGGGITYFIMPAVFNSLVDHRGYGADTAWRLTFLVPLVVVLAAGAALLLLCPDTPDGPWAERQAHAQQHLAAHHIHVEQDPALVVVGDRGGGGGGLPAEAAELSDQPASFNDDKFAQAAHAGSGDTTDSASDHEARLSSAEMLATARGEIVVAPTAREVLQVAASRHTWALMLPYMCSFGAELAINGTLAAYYLHNFPRLGQTGSSSWAAMFGFLNFATRPLGGAVADLLYHGSRRRRSRGAGDGDALLRHHQHSLWWKRHWITACGVLGGAALVVVGHVDPHHEAAMFGLVALSAVFLEAGNGANFALVPHVHPFANGVVSGLAGAAGNLGGVIFSIIFRFTTTTTAAGAVADYARAFWIIGVIHVAVNLAVSWIPPIPKDQVGGH